MNLPINVDAIRARLAEEGWTQAELAEASRLSKRTVEGILKRGTASLESLHRMAAALEVDVSVLRPATQTHQARQAQHTPVGRLHQLPAPLQDFVGRSEEAQELAARLRGGGRVGLSALGGMGGVGKTTLAVHVAHLVKADFPDGQILIDLQGVSAHPLSAAEVMARLIRDFVPEAEKLPESESELLPLYRSTLAGKRALILLDNAKDESQVKNLVTGGETGFLITSRNALALDAVSLVRLDTLPPDQSLAMLRNIVGPRGTDEELCELVALCDSLPLALRVAGDFLRLKSDWAVSRYIEALKQERLRWLRVGKDFQKDVEAVLTLSAAQLHRDNPDLALRWQLLAGLPSDFDAEVSAAAWGMESDEQELATLDDLSELVNRSMVLFDERTFRYRLHDLMRPVAEGLEGLRAGSPEGREARKCDSNVRVARRLVKRLDKLDALYGKGRRGSLAALAEFERDAGLVRHYQAWAARQFETHPDDLRFAEVCRDYALHGGWVLSLRLHLTERARLLTSSLAACRRLLDRKAEITALGNLGAVHSDLGDMQKAAEYHEQAVRIARDIGSRRAEGWALNNLGNARAALNEVGKAAECFEEALAAARELGIRHLRGAALNGLGAALMSLGELSRARPYLQEALHIAREIGHRWAERVALTNLASTCSREGESRRAVDYLEEALAIARELGDWWAESQVLSNLGSEALKEGDAGRAVELFERALDGARETGGGDTQARSQFGLVRALTNLGEQAGSQGDRQNALGYFERALNIAQEMGSPVVEASAMGTYGDALLALGSPRRGIDYLEQALALARAVGDRQVEGASLERLRDAWASLGDEQRAASFDEQLKALDSEGAAVD